MRNIFIDESLMCEQVKGRQRDIERRHLLKHVPAPRHHWLSRLMSRLQIPVPPASLPVPVPGRGTASDWRTAHRQDVGDTSKAAGQSLGD